MGHKHSVYDSDTHFSISAITRAIKNESSKKTTLIQGDHNSERFSFDLPRFIEGHDMMNCNLVEVHFTNKDEQTGDINKDYYEVKDMQISPSDSNIIVFSWLIDERATLLAGLLEFQIKFKCMTGGVCDYKWNTAINSEISIASALDNSGEVVERTPNVVDQWRSEIFGDAENAVANINLAEQEAIEAVQKAGEDITNVAEIAKADVFKVTANAIKGTASGEVISVDDVSKVEHEMAVKVHSKNLIDTNNLVVSGSSAWQATRILFDKPAGTYTISVDFEQNGENTTIQVSAKDYLTGSTFYGSKNSAAADGSVLFTFTIPEDKEKAYIYFYSNYAGNAANTECEFTNIQIEEGTEATEFTPYAAPETVEVTRCGKNILGYADDFEITQDGLTISYDADNQIFTINGTPEKASFSINFGSHLFDALALPIGTDVALSIEHISGKLAAESMTNVFYLGNSDSADGGRNNWFSVPLPTSGKKTNFATATRNYFTRTWLYIGSEYDVTFTDYKFRVQLEAGTEATDHETFKGMKHTPSADGTVSGMMSTSPNMTILTDTEGVVIECEYNVDTKTYIDKKFEELKTLLQG